MVSASVFRKGFSVSNLSLSRGHFQRDNRPVFIEFRLFHAYRTGKTSATGQRPVVIKQVSVSLIVHHTGMLVKLRPSVGINTPPYFHGPVGLLLME